MIRKALLASPLLLLAGCIESPPYYGTPAVPAPAPIVEQVPAPPLAHPYWVFVRGHWRWNGYRWVWIRGHYQPA